MIGFIDKKIEALLLRMLHKKREKFIAKTIAAYIAKNNPDLEIIAELRNKLEIEATRVFAIVDKSIVVDRIKRARYTFWITAVLGTTLTLALAVFPVTSSIAPFFAPLLTAFGTWVISVATIPISYNQRVLGAMNSAVLVFDLDRSNPDQLNEPNNTVVDVVELQKSLQQLQQQVAELTEQISQANTPLLPTEDKPMRLTSMNGPLFTPRRNKQPRHWHSAHDEPKITPKLI